MAYALVIGGGIGGLSAAIALRRVGITPLVFEQAEALQEIGAGLTLWSNAVKVLTHLGLDDALSWITSPLEEAQTRSVDGKVQNRVDLSKLAEAVGYQSVGIHRGELLEILLDKIPHAVIRTGARFEHFRERKDGVTACFSDGARETGDVLIGADGIFSSVRDQLFLDSRPKYAGYVCWRGVTQFGAPPGWPANASVRSSGRGKHFGLVQLSPNRFFWYATRNQSRDEPEGGGRKATLLRHFGDWHEPIPAVLEATPETEMLRHGVYEMSPLRAWGRGRVTMLGDAAHPMRPSLGMGACQAMEDALVLADDLRRHEAIPALREYERRRRRRATLTVRFSDFLARTEQLENPVLRALRDGGTRLTPDSVTRGLARAAFSFAIHQL